ncbi:MAG TPA: FAD-dependent oxidoreductase [Casimicrobiaceae bacterium]|nr:FAD-dependent oxidoreductase [Casimicrobiaceae bacterium]
MNSHARVVVIGGGVVGCSVLYHLTKLGWRDVLLIERSELTSGSTWHAAGGMHTVNGDPNVAKLQAYTIELYKEIEQASGHSCGIHLTGGLMLASTPERLDFLKLLRARARYLRLDMELVSLDEAERMFPLLDKRQFVGALYNTLEGHVDPSGVTQAYAKAARANGADVVRFNRVVETIACRDGGWDVVTEHGTVHAEHVVNAAGLWAREVGRMAGLSLPVLAMEHQYLITEDIPEVLESPREMLHIIDFDGEIYMRQEGRGGMLIGTYERDGKVWSEHATPWSFGHDLLPDDLERIMPSLETGFAHYPALARAGIKKIINGPFTFTPDGNPLVGPVRGLSNYWVACGVMAGLSQGGGVGLALSNWIVHGDPGHDIWGMDVARYGDWATKVYTNAKVRETYSRRFRIRFPNEELAAARPLRTTPIYDELRSAGAVFGVAYGLEHALWYAPAGNEPVEDITFRRSNAHAPVGDECRAVRNAVGLMEITTYAKYEISGRGAQAWLAHLLAGHVPKIGRLSLNPMLSTRGHVVGDFTLARLGDESFVLFGSGIAENYHLRWFERHPPDPSVCVRPLGSDWCGIAIAGPRSRDVLACVTDADVSNAAFPFMGVQRMSIALASALVGRISFTGELGYEIWVTADYQRGLFSALIDAGTRFGVRLFGARALNALRLEKSFGNWAREFRPIYRVGETGLARFIDFDKGDFIGREAALAEQREGPRRRLNTFVIDETDVDAMGDEPIWHDGAVVGWVTSGGFGHVAGTSIALGYVPAALADAIEGYEIEIIGERKTARVARAPLVDPKGERMRS